jgi:L-threonylcarbamoyladenylate synthase
MSERIKLTEENIEEAVAQAAEVLRAGGVLLYPTDTLYGLGADSLNREALDKIFAIKGRDEGKPIHSIVAEVDAAAPYAVVSPLAQALSDKLLPGPLTLLLAKTATVPEWAVSGRDTFGIRVPANTFCLALADAFGKPYTATSANKAGQEPMRNVDVILAQLGDAANTIDLIIDAGELPASQPSTVVDARGKEPVVLRKGAIPTDQILTFSAE